MAKCDYYVSRSFVPNAMTFFEYLKYLCHPFENKRIDTALAIFFLCISIGSFALSIYLSVRPYPVSFGYKLSRYLMYELDSKDCNSKKTSSHSSHS
jgi:hypothetical protein